MKILHVASFNGNIGDIASHKGLEVILGKVGISYDAKKLEIRDFYKNANYENKMEFDKEFVKLANNYELVLFGGGGFLDYWVPESFTGTTIDIDINNLKNIKSKILITSVGSNPHKEIPEGNYEKFLSFITHCNSSDNITIRFRNDGSVNSLKKDFPSLNITKDNEILDHAFFFKAPNYDIRWLPKSYVTINITEDQIRMINGIGDNDSWYYLELKNLINNLIDKYNKVIFVPHIPSDVNEIMKVISFFDREKISEKIIIAPFIGGEEGANFLFSIYQNSALNIVSRYHANVYSLLSNVPTIGLSNLGRVEYLHSQLSNYKSYIDIKPMFSDRVVNLINKIKEKGQLKESYLNDLMKKTVSFYRDYLR